nr:hypothetical protein [Tanacetum cinerariifolium]
MTLEKIKEKFDLVWKQIQDFIPVGSKEEAKRFKRKGLRMEQESVKKLKTSEGVKATEEVPEEKVKEMMQLVPIEEVVDPPSGTSIRTKIYAELSIAKKIQVDCDMKSCQGSMGENSTTMQGTLLTKQERECKLYDAFDKFSHIKGESLYHYYLRFTQLINNMNIYNLKLEQFQVNTKFLNSLPPEWSKFVTDVKLVKDLHTTNFDQLNAYLEQHELHTNEVCLLREHNPDPLAFTVNQQITPHHFNTYQSLDNNSQLQQ